jgi:hypothetical protein
MDFDKPIIIDLPKIVDSRGNLSFIEEMKHFPFPIKRVYWVYDVPGGQKRGGHAFKRQRELIVALSGSFEVSLDDGSGKKSYRMNRSYFGLYVPNMHWREIEDFATNSLALVVSSTEYDEGDYIRDQAEFMRLAAGGSSK